MSPNCSTSRLGVGGVAGIGGAYLEAFGSRTRCRGLSQRRNSSAVRAGGLAGTVFWSASASTSPNPSATAMRVKISKLIRPVRSKRIIVASATPHCAARSACRSRMAWRRDLQVRANIEVSTGPEISILKYLLKFHFAGIRQQFRLFNRTLVASETSRRFQ